MEIFLTKEGKSVGPFSAAEIREKMKAGEVGAEESAWSAEVGKWMRLEQVLEIAADGGGGRKSAGKKGSGKKGTPPQPPEPESEGRERSRKLQSPSSIGEGRSGGFDKPVEAMPNQDEKLREAKRLGGASAKRANPVGFMRWLGVIAFLAIVFSIFMPWVKTSYGDSITELSALNVITAKGEDFVLPGTSETVKYFGASKTMLLGSLGLIVLVLLLSVSNALNREAGSSGMAVLLGGLAILLLAGFGAIYGLSFERQFNAALADANQVLGNSLLLVFKMGPGFYFSLAAAFLMLACLMIPQIIRAPLTEEMMPAAVTLLIAGGIAFIGSRTLSSDSVGDAAESIGGLINQGVKTVKETLGELDGGGSTPPPVDADGSDSGADAAGGDPFAP